VTKSNVPIVALLLEHHAIIDIPNLKRETSLTVASQIQNAEVMELLQREEDFLRAPL
jgi:ankyrin repeat protein